MSDQEWKELQEKWEKEKAEQRGKLLQAILNNTSKPVEAEISLLCLSIS